MANFHVIKLQAALRECVGHVGLDLEYFPTQPNLIELKNLKSNPTCRDRVGLLSWNHFVRPNNKFVILLNYLNPVFIK